tara:strand:- start:240 stop:1112 length:873 start_codon:yes stop_codon:yes gene_type:complete
MSIKNITMETVGLHVGASDWARPSQATLSRAGTLTCAGMSIFGDCSDIGGIASVTIGTADGDSLQKNKRLSLHVKGNSVLQGDSQTANALTVSGGKTHTARFYGLQHTNAVYIDGDLFVSGSIDGGNKGRLATRFGTADARPKPFDIQHPTKGEGHRLRYACIEGPEVGVYYRGRLKDSNVIKLPDYWKNLVHEDSITVQLQPIGDRHFHLNVVSFNSEKIIIKEADDKIIDCFYHVYGERKDINPLIVEYEGKSWEDYPDPNFNPNKVDDDKKTYNDPQFNGPPNTITT